MMRKINLFLGVLFFSGTMGFAQIKKHSFGAGVNNGTLFHPALYGTPSGGGEPVLLRSARSPYVFGLQGSHLKSSNKWLAWKTTINISTTSMYNYDKFDADLKDTRSLWADIGFGPMFTFQRKDFGVYLGGTLDIKYFAEYRVRSQPGRNNEILYAPYPLLVPTAHLGYWQRMGNVNSPWYLEIALIRQYVPGIFTLFNYSSEPGPYLYNLTVGFRYEFEN